MGRLIEAACGCSTGKVRSNNEDNFYFAGQCLDTEHDGLKETLRMETPVGAGVLLSVFDGMGGENFGEVASFAAAHRLRQMMQEKKKPADLFGSPRKYLEKVAGSLNDAVVAAARELRTSRMGTTMAGLYLCRYGAYGVNIGDSRIYRLHDGVLTQLSVDHVERSTRKKAPLTQHLGIDPEEMTIEPWIVKTKPRKGDMYLLCSDGLTDLLADEEIACVMDAAENTPLCAERLIRLALERGGRDNITVIVCKVIA